MVILTCSVKWYCTERSLTSFSEVPHQHALLPLPCWCPLSRQCAVGALMQVNTRNNFKTAVFLYWNMNYSCKTANTFQLQEPSHGRPVQVHSQAKLIDATQPSSPLPHRAGLAAAEANAAPKVSRETKTSIWPSLYHDASSNTGFPPP